MLVYFSVVQNHEQHHKEDYGETNHLPSSPQQLCRCFSLAEIKSATKNFNKSLIIGKGGFAVVYKGVIDNGACTVAIKRLDVSKQSLPEFWSEIKMLSKFRHSHLLSLLGYCKDWSEMILVYEFMPGGTLEDHLHKLGRADGCFPPLSWVQRLEICIGAARGLDYLHTGTCIQQRVLHRDVKSSNILLDENYQAKISDFGLSTIGPANRTCSTNVYTHQIKGTFGYMDPEYFLTHRLTRKSDVYAFGVVLFEVLFGRPAVDSSLESEQIGLAGWAQHSVRAGTLDHNIEPSLREQILPDCLYTFVQLSNQCLLRDPRKRPTMAEIVVRLESALALQVQKGPSPANEDFTHIPYNYNVHEITDSSKEFDSNYSHNDGGYQDKQSDESLHSFKVAFVHPSNGGGHQDKHIGDNIPLDVPNGRQPHMKPLEQEITFVQNLLQSFHSTKASLKSDAMPVQEIDKKVEMSDKSGKIVYFDAPFKIMPDSFLRSEFVVMGKGPSWRSFKVLLEDGNLVVTKWLRGAKTGKEFETDIAALGKINHPNVLPLCACYLGPRRTDCISIYMPKGSLASYLRGNTSLGGPPATSVDWPTRMNILLGITRGLCYLHNQENIIHGGLTSINIMLDDHNSPMIADVGLSRLMTKAAATSYFSATVELGYRAPESMLEDVSMELDVYSLGVIIMEIVTGKSPRKTMGNLGLVLPQWVRSMVMRGTPEVVIDLKLTIGAPNTHDQLVSTLYLALDCVDLSSAARPEVQQVLQELEMIQRWHVA